MHGISALFCALGTLASAVGLVAGNPGVVGIQKYTQAHSLGENYEFNPRDGWEMVNATNLQYKYRRGSPTRKVNYQPKYDYKGVGGVAKAIINKVNKVLAAMKGIGNPEPVTITWYTGHDLLNPSCWPKTGWAPTDASFGCALTMEGWKNRPKCFEFIELCSNPHKCVFVRVIDTCAGCAKGSKHVDLTKAAFSGLADLDQGILTVHMRPATDPPEWYEFLWGPRHG